MLSLRIYTDGGARGNPGPAAAGAVLKRLSEDGNEEEIIDTVSEYLGKTTNNQAEYYALIFALQHAKKLGAEKIEVCMDSELIVKQLKRQYKVKHPEIAKRFMEADQLLNSFPSFSIRHVRREYNKEADALVNQAIDSAL